MTTLDLPRPDVPQPIAVVRDFVNTIDLETESDELTTASDLTRYLVRERLLDGSTRATTADLDLARRLRAGLRGALEQNHDGTIEPVSGLASALHDLSIGLDWSGSGPVLRVTAPGVRGALARIGLAVQQAASDGIWWRLKICSSEECAWAYYDHSKNRSRSWCEYGCGNKIKTRAYRARQRAASTT